MMCEPEVTRTVYPSGAARATAEAPPRPDRYTSQRFAGNRQAAFDLIAPSNHTCGRRLEASVLDDHAVDCVFVGNLGVFFFDVGDPQRNESAPEVAKTTEEIDTSHLLLRCCVA